MGRRSRSKYTVRGRVLIHPVDVSTADPKNGNVIDLLDAFFLLEVWKQVHSTFPAHILKNEAETAGALLIQGIRNGKATSSSQVIAGIALPHLLLKFAC